uniref:Putative secreted protein n=1 Tax=Lutzomyia longipalpis TaxID=7200 RepID=A0A7G3ALF0_LUTLO
MKNLSLLWINLPYNVSLVCGIVRDTNNLPVRQINSLAEDFLDIVCMEKFVKEIKLIHNGHLRYNFRETIILFFM